MRFQKRFQVLLAAIFFTAAVSILNLRYRFTELGLQIPEFNAELLHKRAINGVVMIVQLKGGMSEHAHNLICSLSKLRTLSNSSLASNLVFWAYDHQTYHKLLILQNQMPRSDQFGIIHDPEATRLWNLHAYSDFLVMMKYRPRFILKVLKLGLHLLFIDADLIFFRDPFKWIASRQGMGTDQYTGSYQEFLQSQPPVSGSDMVRKAVELEYKMLTSNEADVVYSTDARDFYSNLDDPLEGGNSVARVCGGLFLARSTPNTIQMFEKLLVLVELGSHNDQDGVDALLNFETWKLPIGLQSVMVGKLPRCLPRWKGMPRRHCSTPIQPTYNETEWPKWMQTQLKQGQLSSGVLKVRILDQAQFLNGILYQRHLLLQDKQSALDQYEVLFQTAGQQVSGLSVDQLPSRIANRESHQLQEADLKPQDDRPAKIAVSLHGNYPPQYIKKLEMAKVGAWMLQENGQCQ